MASKNEHTGASIRVGGGFSPEGEKNFEAIFGTKEKPKQKINEDHALPEIKPLPTIEEK